MPPCCDSSSNVVRKDLKTSFRRPLRVKMRLMNPGEQSLYLTSPPPSGGTVMCRAGTLSTVRLLSPSRPPPQPSSDVSFRRGRGARQSKALLSDPACPSSRNRVAHKDHRGGRGGGEVLREASGSPMAASPSICGAWESSPPML